MPATKIPTMTRENIPVPATLGRGGATTVRFGLVDGRGVVGLVGRAEVALGFVNGTDALMLRLSFAQLHEDEQTPHVGSGKSRPRKLTPIPV